MIKTVLIILYLYCLLPFLIGTVISLLTRHSLNMPYIYVYGYTVYLSLFSITTIWAEKRNIAYTPFMSMWKLFICIISAIVIVFIILYYLCWHKSLITISKTSNFKVKGLSYRYRNSIIIVLLTLFLIILAVCFLVPHSLDETPELARLTLRSNAVFSTNPSTGEIYISDSARPGCIHLFYAIGSTLTGIDVTSFIHLIIPVFLIPFFICCYIMIATFLFPDKTQSSERFIFIWLSVVFYLLLIPLEAHISMTPFRNIWNGITLSASCFFPLFFAVCVDLIRHCAGLTPRKKTIPYLSVLETVIMIICIILAVRLCTHYGVILCFLIVLSVFFVLGIRVINRQRVSIRERGGKES